MSNVLCSWTERDAVDFVTDKMDPGKRERFAAHWSNCKGCTDTVTLWAELLDGRSRLTADPGPPQRLKLRLKAAVRRRKRIRARSALRKAAALLVVVCAITAVMTARVQLEAGSGKYAGTGTAGGTESPSAGWRQTVVAGAGSQLAMDPGAVLYEVVPVVRSQVRGFAWINEDSQDLLLLVEGLQRSGEQEYYVWYTHENKRWNAGLVQWDHGRAQIFYHGLPSLQVDSIMFSIEPAGADDRMGKLRNVPTSIDGAESDSEAGKSAAVLIKLIQGQGGLP